VSPTDGKKDNKGKKYERRDDRDVFTPYVTDETRAIQPVYTLNHRFSSTC